MSHAGGGSLSADLVSLLNANNFAVQGADLVSLTGGSDAGSYVVINNAGTAGFDSLHDAVIKLTNGGVSNVAASSFIV